jgi:hypothetical protein
MADNAGWFYSSLCVLILGFATSARGAVGATTPFTSYEAESGLCGGGATVFSLTSAPTTPYSSPQLEASGHAYVQLAATGQYVQWTNNTGLNITALNLRSCIPDATNGGGIVSTIDFYVNGTFRQAFPVNSQQNYCYEGTNYNGQTDKNPADGDPRGFWNDTHAFVTGPAIAPGDTFGFQEDSSNTAAFYYIDVIDLETPPPPLTQPTNSLSITAYGAIAGNPAFDNTSAINNCFSAALSQRKSAWIPPGTFYINGVSGGLSASGTTIAGAGPWYSTIYRVVSSTNVYGVANIINAVSCSLSNVLLDCNASSRAGNNNNGAIDFSGTNWLVENVWIQHATSSFWCAGVNGMAANCRTLSTWADGGNFNNVQSDNGIGMNLTYSNNFVRGTGDDAMAINSVYENVFGTTTNYYTMMSNIKYVNNTAIGAWGGKGIGVYGGINDLVTNNLLRDTARYIGLGVMRFGVNGSDLLSATVTGNTVLRCGGNGYSQQQQALMIGNGGDGQSVGTVANVYCASNTIIDSLYDGVGFSTGSNIVFQYNTIINPGMDGMAVGAPDLGSGVMGTAILNSNVVTGLNPGQLVFTNSSLAYAAITPTAGAAYSSMSGVTTQLCSEGGQDIGGLSIGDWSAYTDADLDGVDAFVARVASAGAGGGIQIRLDGTNGTLIGSCVVPVTGGAQTYADTFCSVNNISGTHNVYLVYTGVGSPFSLEFFGFFAAPPVFSHQLAVGNTYSLTALVNGKYVTEDAGQNNQLFAEGSSVGTAQEFQIVDAGGGSIALQSVANGFYVSADNDGASPLIANRTAVGSWETYTEVSRGNGSISVRAMNDGMYVTVETNNGDVLIAQGPTLNALDSFNVGFVSGTAPAPPVGLTATPGHSDVLLAWTGSPGATGYNVKSSASNGGPYTVVASNLAGVTYTNAGLANGAAVYFVVSALNPAGESTNCPPVRAVAGSLLRSGWAVTASSTESGGSPANAIDGNITTRWSTGLQQTYGQWFEVDMGATNTFYELILDASGSSTDYPRGYQINVSNDGTNWGAVVASGAGSSAVTTIPLPTETARFIRITQTGSVSGLWWSIDEFNVLGTMGAPPSAPTGLTAVPGDGLVALSWTPSLNATGYNVKQSTVSNGTYAVIATNLAALAFASSELANGLTYYFVVSAVDASGESGESAIVSAQPVSTSPPQLRFGIAGGQVQLGWPSDHISWSLQVQTNGFGLGLGTNWVTVPASSTTNQMSFPIDAASGSIFFRLVYP